MSAPNPYETHTRRIHHHLARVATAAQAVEDEAHAVTARHYLDNPRPQPAQITPEATDA